MLDDESTEVNSPTETDATFGTLSDEAENSATSPDEQPGQKTDESSAIEADADAAIDEEIDLEAILLSEDAGAPAPETKEEQPKEELGIGTETKGITDRLAVLKTLGEELAKLPENPDESNTTRILRKLNKELVRNQETELAQIRDNFGFAPPEKVKEALEITDNLFGYDAATGKTTSEPFAKALVARDPDHAYQTVIDLMMQTTPQGVVLADAFVKNILQLDRTKLEIFQAISRGETPEGYEAVVTNSKELEAVPTEFHAAYKRLSPKMRDIVRDGVQQYATQAERHEALKVLGNEKSAIERETAEQTQKATRQQEFEQSIDTAYDGLIGEFNQAMPQRLETALNKLVFSSDAHVDETIRYGLKNAVRDIVDPNSVESAKRYFENRGVDKTEIEKQFARASDLFAQIERSIAVEARASAEKQGTVLARAKESRIESERRLLAIGVSLAAKAAQKTGATLAGAAKAKTVPENRMPNIPNNSSLGNYTGKTITAESAAAATRMGKVIAGG